jgi:hypothetical protein
VQYGGSDNFSQLTPALHERSPGMKDKSCRTTVAASRNAWQTRMDTAMHEITSLMLICG